MLTITRALEIEEKYAVLRKIQHEDGHRAFSLAMSDKIEDALFYADELEVSDYRKQIAAFAEAHGITTAQVSICDTCGCLMLENPASEFCGACEPVIAKDAA